MVCTVVERVVLQDTDQYRLEVLEELLEDEGMVFDLLRAAEDS